MCIFFFGKIGEKKEKKRRIEKEILLASTRRLIPVGVVAIER